jgi:uncharacterized membrane protein YhaH (DUF805 family)
MEGLAHYLFSFGGRINRAKMWAFSFIVSLIYQLLFFALQAITVGFGDDAPDFFGTWPTRPQEWAFAIPSCVLMLAGAWSSLAVTVKRLHDRDRSVWWLLLFFGGPLGLLLLMLLPGVAPENGSHATPSLGFFLLLAPFAFLALWFQLEMYLLPGTRGPNRFGPDPLARD